jgi:hypothetical protein
MVTVTPAANKTGRMKTWLKENRRFSHPPLGRTELCNRSNFNHRVRVRSDSILAAGVAD